MNIHILIAASVSWAMFVSLGMSAEPASQADHDSSVSAASADNGESAITSTDEAARDEILNWLDQYLTKEVLFRKEDIESLRAKVAQMPPSDLQAWMTQSQEIRDTLDGEQWKSTRVWLEGYLPTQLYNDREMEQFRKDVGEMSPSDLLELLRRIQQKHDTLQSVYDSQYSSAVRAKQAQATAQMNSETRMSWLNSYEKNQSAARKQAAQRNQTRSTRPLYGQTQARASNRHTEASRRYNQPLITSKEAASIAVRRGIYGGFRGGW